MDEKEKKIREENQKKNRREETARMSEAAASGAGVDTARRYGKAVSAYETAYNGYDPKSGRTYTRTLEKLPKYAKDPKNPSKTTKQYAGFAAEILENADRNAQHAIDDDGKSSSRTDDLDHSDPRYANYGTNDQYVDLLDLDINGDPITDSETQVKFVGNSPKACLDKLASRKFQKYLDRGVKLLIPKDYYEEVMQAADEKIASLEEQLKHAEETGNTELAEKIQEEIDRYKQIEASLVPSTLTKAEAEYAAAHPKVAVGIRIAERMVQSGIQAAAAGAALGGLISIVRNLTAYEKGEITKEEAIQNVARDTARSAGAGFVTGAEGALLSGILLNSKNEFLQQVGASSLPVMIVMQVNSSFRIMKRYSEGEIDAAECVSLLCETGMSQVTETAGAKMVSGAAAKVITAKIGSLQLGRAIGGAAGGVMGYVLTNITLKALREARQRYHVAREYRIAVEEECEERIHEMELLQRQMKTLFNQSLRRAKRGVRKSFALMDCGAESGDMDIYLAGVSCFRNAMGLPDDVMTQRQFDACLESGQPLVL